MRIRPVIRDKIPTQPERAKFLADVLDDQDVWALLRDNRDDEAFEKVMREGGLQ